MISSARPKSRREALERLLLSGTTVMRFGLQWFLILGLLLALEWMLMRVVAPGSTELVSRALRISLCICPIVTTIVSFAAIRRSRALWLLAGSSRGEFFSSVERILLRMNLAMVLVTGVWLAAVWLTLSWQPGPFLEQLHVLQFFWLEAFLIIGILASYSQLAQLPKWPIAIPGACLLATAWSAYAAIEPGTTSNALTGTIAAVLVPVAGTATIALRWLAQRRWCNGDFPRAATSPSAAS